MWTYTLDNTNAAVQALNGAATLTDTFTALTADGTAQLVTITIHAQNDAAVITGDATGDVTEAGGVPTARPARRPTPATSTRPTSTTPADAWQAVAAGAATANGYGTYAADGGRRVDLHARQRPTRPCRRSTARDTLTDTFTALTADGTAQIGDDHDPRRRTMPR